MLLTVTRLSLSHAGLPSQSVGVWGYPQPPEANVKWFSVASPGLLGIFSFFGGRKKAGVAMLGRLGGRLALGKMARLDPVRLPRQVCRLRARPGAVLLLPLRLTAQPPFRPNDLVGYDRGGGYGQPPAVEDYCVLNLYTSRGWLKSFGSLVGSQLADKSLTQNFFASLRQSAWSFT